MSLITLQSGGCSAAVTTDGAELVSFVDTKGVEHIWQADPAVWADHGPILFPVIGNVRNGQVSVSGTAYPMPKHGLLRGAAFSVDSQGADWAALRFDSSERTLQSYPFQFRLTVLYQLERDQISCQLRAENLDQRPMPFHIGGHPAFICPMEGGAGFEDYELRFEKKETGMVAVVNEQGLVCGTDRIPLGGDRVLPLRHAWFDQRDTLLFAGLNSRSASLVLPASGHGLCFSFPDFSTLAVWSKPHQNADYVCLEPWCGLPQLAEGTDEMAWKPFAQLLEPGKARSFTYAAGII